MWPHIHPVLLYDQVHILWMPVDVVEKGEGEINQSSGPIWEYEKLSNALYKNLDEGFWKYPTNQGCVFLI